MTLTEDWPGFGKKGDIIIGCMEHTPTADGKTMIGRHSYGEMWVTEIKTYNPQSKEIVTTQSRSNGSIGYIREYKSGGEWKVSFTDISPDGTKSESVGTTVFSNDGQTWTIKSGGLGQSKDEWSTSVYRRISK